MAAEPARLSAEFSPEMAELLSPGGRDALLSQLRGKTLPCEALRTRLRRHLLAVGWRIVARSDPNDGAAAPRLSYHAPAGHARTFYSLPTVIYSLTGGKPKVTTPRHHRALGPHHDQGAIAIATGEAYKPAPPPVPEKEREGAIAIAIATVEEYKPAPAPAAEEEGEGAIAIVEEYNPAPAPAAEEEEEDAVAEYVRMVVSKAWGQGARARRLLGKAKGRLLSSGWTARTRTRTTGRSYVYFRAPNGGRSYASLVTACQAFLAAPPVRAGPPLSSNESMSMVIDPPSAASPSISSCKCKRRRSTVSTFLSDHDADALKSCFPDKKRRKKKKKAHARVLKPKDGDRQPLLPSACQQRHARTLLSLLNDRSILARREKLSYRPAGMDGPPAKEGLVAGDASLIRCTCGCGKAELTVAEFVAHAGGLGLGLGRLFLKDGRSLAQCLLQMMAEDGRGAAAVAPLRPRLKERCSHERDDAVCSVCHDYGELLLCDNCPSSFHRGCVGMEEEDTPEGDWFCPCCRCAVCRSSHFHPADGSHFTDDTIIYCDQCEREQHVGCMRGGSGDIAQGPWLCSGECSEIFERLQGLVGRSTATSAEGLRFTVLRASGAAGRRRGDEAEAEAVAEQHGKLRVALDILHECFVTLMEPRTNSDVAEDIVFNRESELRRLNFRGFYMIGIEKGGELITVGTLRVYGNKVAELPLVGTRFVHRRQGMCRLMMNELEKLLGQLGVERLVLPAVPELLQTWTGSFGFRVMSRPDRLEIAEHTILSFRGTSMCHKLIATAPATTRRDSDNTYCC